MAQLTATSVPNNAAVNVAAASIGTAPFTISQADVGSNGALVNIINGSGSPITVTVEDPGVTGLGNSPSEPAQSVAAAGDRWFRVVPGNVDQTTGFATLTLSSPTSVTYKLVRA